MHYLEIKKDNKILINLSTINCNLANFCGDIARTLHQEIRKNSGIKKYDYTLYLKKNFDKDNIVLTLFTDNFVFDEKNSEEYEVILNYPNNYQIGNDLYKVILSPIVIDSIYNRLQNNKQIISLLSDIIYKNLILYCDIK